MHHNKRDQLPIARHLGTTKLEQYMETYVVERAVKIRSRSVGDFGRIFTLLLFHHV